MAVKNEYEPVTEFDDWYVRREEDQRDGSLVQHQNNVCADRLWHDFEEFKREHGARVANYWKYETMADAEVVSTKPDLPNVSSGEIAGIVRRTARNVVQNTPNVEVICEFDNSTPKGVLAKHVLRTKILAEELNSNEMQQNLFASVMSAFTLGFDAVVPVLTQNADRSWCMEYDPIHYQDVFPEPGIKDVRKAPVVFVRRYLTKGELRQLIRRQPVGWDVAALRTLAKSTPPNRQHESVSHQDKKHKTIPRGYELITWYSNSGDPFLTFDASNKMLLRIEKNKDPLMRHPVHFLVLEKDPQQPLGKSQISLVFGRQEFQDLMLNGAMKLWYRNINPTLIGYGTGLNGVPNMGPGKYTNIPNPNAKIEAFEVSTQTLLQYGTISQQNQGSMISMIGAADQQMAAQAGNGMSATPQGVEAQQQMRDITTNNYQKSVENFFSQYCSYALTLYFQEIKGAPQMTLTADARRALVSAGMDEKAINADGELDVDLKEMAVVYSVRCIPGSLVELEDEKQLRILNDLLIPISQAMPAFANTQNPEMLNNVAQTIQWIINKQIELSGSMHADELQSVFKNGTTSSLEEFTQRTDAMEDSFGGLFTSLQENSVQQGLNMQTMQEQLAMLAESQGLLLQKLGVTTAPSVPAKPEMAVLN